MPAARDYVCSGCHWEFERFGDFSEEVACPECFSPAKWVPSFYYSSRAAQPFAPVVIHQDANGNVRFPGSVNAPVPEGFQKVELTNTREIRKFESRVNAEERERLQATTRAREEYMSGQIKCNREALEAGVWVKQQSNPDPNAPPVFMRLSEFSGKGREFYDRMREQADARRKRTRQDSGRGEPGFHLEAFSMDSSNRAPHRDFGNDWGRSGGRK